MTGQRVGVAGDDRLEAIVETAGGTPIRAQSPPADPVQCYVVSGESAIVDLVRAGLDAPVLPVGFDNGFRSVPFGDAETAVARVLEDPESQPTERYPIVAATGPFDPIRILFDIALVAAEPARISEFAVHRGQDRIAQFRADGVVASPPAGSGGYNRNAGGPTLEPGTGVAAVVPIAPFATAVGQWVLSIDSVRLSVEREEAPVELLADGRRERTMTTDGSISLSRVDELETYAVPELEELS